MLSVTKGSITLIIHLIDRVPKSYSKKCNAMTEEWNDWFMITVIWTQVLHLYKVLTAVYPCPWAGSKTRCSRKAVSTWLNNLDQKGGKGRWETPEKSYQLEVTLHAQREAMGKSISSITCLNYNKRHYRKVESGQESQRSEFRTAFCSSWATWLGANFRIAVYLALLTCNTGITRPSLHCCCKEMSQWI